MNPRDPSDDDLAPLLRIGLEEDGDFPMPTSRPQSWEPPNVDALQRALPQYEISGFIARGGMGAVYRGTQKALRRTVAIKVLPPGIDDGDRQFAARFQQEAQTLARLTHPNIVGIHEAGETTDGLLYLVMEFIDGTDVGQLIASEGVVEPLRAIQITSAVCEALAFAHGEGIIHRDIKPSNIMLDTKGRVKVADFGLAKAGTLDRAPHSGTDLAMGTPDFVAPEALIRGMKVDQRADIYAVGVMLYQMLTGQIPRGRFASPSSVVPQVDKRLDAVVDKALQPDREQRYGTAKEIRQDLNTIQTTPRVTAGAEVPMQAALPGRKAKLGLWIGLAAGGLGLGVVLFFAMRPAKPIASGDSHAPNLPVSSSSPATATKDAPFVNTLGMKFVPVPIRGGPTGGQRGSPEGTGPPLGSPGNQPPRFPSASSVPGAATSVLFSVWDTRVQDYATFATETKRDWPKPEFEQGATHPAVMVSWADATAFCAWLTERERKAGQLSANERYRLPSDHEWSCAVGIGAREDAAKLPSEKDGKITDAFPAGTQWPPLKGTGNYAGEELQPDREAGKFKSAKAHAADKADAGDFVASGYNDGFVNTSPVGSFAANRFGLYDLGGNVRQWCEDWFDQEQRERVLRGASWNGRRRSVLLSSARNHNGPAHPGPYDGFRCVLDSASAARSSTTQSFPVGQWTRVPPEALHEPDIVTDAEGWSLGPASRTRIEVPGARGRNWGLRATFRNQPVGEHMPELVLRRKNGSLSAQLYREGTIFVVLQSNDAAPEGVPRYQPLSRTRLNESVPAGAPFTIEFVAVGAQLVARCHGTTVRCAAPPDGPASGEVAIRGPNYDAFRDVEVLNLEGLSEAEAMKVAGMDAAAAK